ncbi:MAG: hypothetical protein HC904_01065 [Blastochloris sp.]|nr:hypothetical protein [Blastochloris sp.]
MLKKINPHLIEWHSYSQECKADLHAHAYISEGKLLLIDPIQPDAATLQAIQTLGKPCAILLTNGNHERYSRIISDLIKVPIAAPAFAIQELSYKPDIVVDGLKQLHGLVPMALEGAGPGEHAYYCPANRILFIGDALIHSTKKGLELLPAKYCSNPNQLKTSLRSLFDLKIDLMAFAHGEPWPNPCQH